MTTRIEELEKEHEELKNKLDIAVQRREYMEKKLFESSYIMDTVIENTVRDIHDSMDKEFLDAVKKYAAKNPKRVGGYD